MPIICLDVPLERWIPGPQVSEEGENFIVNIFPLPYGSLYKDIEAKELTLSREVNYSIACVAANSMFLTRILD